MASKQSDDIYINRSAIDFHEKIKQANVFKKIHPHETTFNKDHFDNLRDIIYRNDKEFDIAALYHLEKLLALATLKASKDLTDEGVNEGAAQKIYQMGFIIADASSNNTEKTKIRWQKSFDYKIKQQFESNNSMLAWDITNMARLGELGLYLHLRKGFMSETLKPDTVTGKKIKENTSCMVPAIDPYIFNRLQNNALKKEPQ